MSPISLNPSTFTEGGSLLDDVDVKVSAAKFVKWDYNGQIQEPIPALGITFADPDGKDHDQYFSCGDSKYFSPSTDNKTPAEEGNYLVPVGDKSALNNNTNGAKFLESLINAGFPADKLEAGDISVLVGLEFHLRRETVKRSGLIRTGKNANREQTVITVARINKLPWEKGVTARPNASASASSTRMATSSATNASPSNGVSVVTAETIMSLLIEHGTIPKAKLAGLVFNALKGNPQQKEAGRLALQDDFLRTIDGASYDKGILTLAA